jgi:hypothetical protein
MCPFPSSRIREKTLLLDALKEIVSVMGQPESDPFYDWQFTANQFILAPSPLRLTTRIYFS